MATSKSPFADSRAKQRAEQRERHRAEVRKVLCPTCDAVMDELCVDDDPESGRSVRRLSNHAKRVGRWKELYGGSDPWQSRMQAGLRRKRQENKRDLRRAW